MDRNMKIEQGTTVYHAEYGKGYILSITYKRQNNQLFCSFGKGNYGFTTEKALRSGVEEITLEPHTGHQRGAIPSEIEQALRELFTGGGDT